MGEHGTVLTLVLPEPLVDRLIPAGQLLERLEDGTVHLVRVRSSTLAQKG